MNTAALARRFRSLGFRVVDDGDVKRRPLPSDAEAKLKTAKRRIAECMEVNRLTFEGVSVAEIMTRTGFSEHKVKVLQRWLGWRHSSLKWALNVKRRALPSRNFRLAPLGRDLETETR